MAARRARSSSYEAASAADANFGTLWAARTVTLSASLAAAIMGSARGGTAAMAATRAAYSVPRNHGSYSHKQQLAQNNGETEKGGGAETHRNARGVLRRAVLALRGGGGEDTHVAVLATALCPKAAQTQDAEGGGEGPRRSRDRHFRK